MEEGVGGRSKLVFPEGVRSTCNEQMHSSHLPLKNIIHL